MLSTIKIGDLTYKLFDYEVYQNSKLIERVSSKDHEFFKYDEEGRLIEYTSEFFDIHQIIDYRDEGKVRYHESGGLFYQVETFSNGSLFERHTNAREGQSFYIVKQKEDGSIFYEKYSAFTREETKNEENEEE